GTDRAQIGKGLGQLRGLGRGTVSNQQLRRLFGQKRFENAPHGPTGTENQNAPCAQRESLAFQVPDQASAVGVVAQQTAVGGFFQGIHGPGTSRPLAEGIGEAIGLFLERHGDIGAVPLAKKLTSKTGKIIQRRQQRLVTQLLARLFSKQTVDQRRLAVANGIAEYAVVVHVIPRFWGVSVTTGGR